MTELRLLVCTLATVLPLVVLTATPASGQDVDAMAKWTSLTVVHYRVVGEFSGSAVVLAGGKSMIRPSATVTDKVEFEFDWNQMEMKLASKPVIRNFPTKVGSFQLASGCSAPKLAGAIEFMTVTSLSEGANSASGVLEFSIKRDLPAGSVCFITEVGPTWEDSPAKSETVPSSFQVMPAMMVAVPGQASPDGKSIVVKSADWTWTLTPTPVK